MFDAELAVTSLGIEVLAVRARPSLAGEFLPPGMMLYPSCVSCVRTAGDLIRKRQERKMTGDFGVKRFNHLYGFRIITR